MSTGVEFRAIRESRGLTVDRIASATRIPVRYIEALERDDIRALPARPYLRGFVAAYGRELGLDPADAVARYFADLGPPPPPEPVTAVDLPSDEPSYSRAWGVAGLVLAVLLAVPALNRWRSGVEPPQPQVAGTTGTAPARPAASTTVAPAAPAATDQGAIVPGPGELVVSMTFERPCWLSASTDGTRVVFNTMKAGSTQVLTASREITMRVGDAGAVRWTLNGRALAPMGGPGEVRTVVLTPGNAPIVK